MRTRPRAGPGTPRSRRVKGAHRTVANPDHAPPLPFSPNADFHPRFSKNPFVLKGMPQISLISFFHVGFYFAVGHFFSICNNATFKIIFTLLCRMDGCQDAEADVKPL
jgi:hypothetical protein